MLVSWSSDAQIFGGLKEKIQKELDGNPFLKKEGIKLRVVGEENGYVTVEMYEGNRDVRSAVKGGFDILAGDYQIKALGSGVAEGELKAVNVLRQTLSYIQEMDGVKRVLLTAVVTSLDGSDLLYDPQNAIAAARNEVRKVLCQNNLQQLGLVLKMFANEHEGKYPEFDPRRDRLIFQRKDVFGEYFDDPLILVCPMKLDTVLARANEEEGPGRVDVFFDDHSYWFPGYALVDEQTGLVFVEECRKRVRAGYGFDEDLEVADKNGKALVIKRLHEKLQSGLRESDIPVIIERPGNHEDGGHVLYMDNHVEFIEYPGKFPMTERFIKALQSLDMLPE